MTLTSKRDLTDGKVLNRLVSFALPIFLANVLQTLYGAVDTMIVGQYVGSAGISAVTVGSQISFFLTTLGMGLAQGGQIIVSQLRGADDEKNLNSVIGALFSIGAICGLAVGIIGAMFYPPALGLLNTPEEAWDQAGDYTLICCLGMVFVFLYNSISSIMRGLGDSTRPLVFIGIATVINIILDIIFVGPLNMGAGGAAIATVMAQALSVLFGIVYLYRRRRDFVFDFKLCSFIPRKRWTLELFRIGVPVMIQMSAINISLSYVLALVNDYGVAASAAVGVGGKLQQIFCMPLQAMSTASTAMSGQNIGAGRLDRVKRTVDITLGVNVVVVAFSALAILLFSGALIRIFDTNPLVVELGALYLKTHIFNIIGHAMFCAYNAACLGAGNALLSTVAFLTDGVAVRLSLCLLFTKVFNWGLLGIFWASAIAPISAGLILGTYYYSGAWRRYKPKALR
ncbi:MAG: MATE family efflux transporter [Oscillospiraceae bacterium]|jgi:putative MATE family efflux protein